ncbi:MAG: ABC transporter substrate-binding protein [Chloroflexi bacterium]|nr:MAG: ABC transporter substrate-binding protein [Chloroflexota bacterium]
MRSGERGSAWRCVLLLVLAVAALAGPLSCGGGSAGPPTVSFYIFHEPSGAFERGAERCSRLSNGRYHIRISELPSTADGQRQQLVRRLAASDPSIDILGMDVVWTAEFAEAGWLRSVPAGLREAVSRGTLGPALRTATWRGTLQALPYNTNTQLLWYRRDLVPSPPATWAQMIDMGTRLEEQGRPGRVEIQGAQYEALTVWFNSLVASAGGRILDDAGRSALDHTATEAAEVMRLLARSPAADPSLSNQHEDDNRLAFETGRAAFELNYPFIYPSARTNAPELFRNLAWALYPSMVAGRPSHVTIGGINLGVSAFSPHPDVAFAAALCLRDADNQRFAAVHGGLPPTLSALYDDPDLRREYPFADTIREALATASVRPLTPAYTNVSLEIQSALAPPSGIQPQRILGDLRTSIGNALNSQGLVP